MSKRQRTLSERGAMLGGGSDDPHHDAISVVVAVWRDIEPCLCLEDTVRVAQACTLLHRHIVDPQTRKIKVSRFVNILGKPELNEDLEGSAEEQAAIGPKQARYVMHALNNIHFPSLQRLHYPPMGLGQRLQIPKELSAQCFILMATNLGYASNLTVLHFSAECLVDYQRDNPQQLQLGLDIFGHNLSRCKSLKTLKISNRTTYLPDIRGVSYYAYSVGLYPAIRQGIAHLELEKFSISCGHGTACDRQAEAANKGKITREFFAAILNQKHLKSFGLDCCGCSPITVKLLLDVCKVQTVVLPELKKLSLNFEDVQGLLDDHPHMNLESTFGKSMKEREYADFTYLLEHFSHCNMLEVVDISFPCEFWERVDLCVLKRFFAGKSQVRGIRLSFNDANDENCAIISQVIECINSNSLEWVILEMLKECNTDLLRKFVKQLQDMGLEEYELNCSNLIRILKIQIP